MKKQFQLNVCLGSGLVWFTTEERSQIKCDFFMLNSFSILESNGVTDLPRPSCCSKVSPGKHAAQKTHQEHKGRRKGGRTIVSHTAFHRIIFEPGSIVLAKY